LIVWGINEGRGAAAEVDSWLSSGSTRLPNAGGIKSRCFVPPPSSLPTKTTESSDAETEEVTEEDEEDGEDEEDEE